MKNISLLLSALVVSYFTIGCASDMAKPTGYIRAASETDPGYAITPTKGTSYVVSYAGNDVTHVSEAFAYTLLAAYEFCSKKQTIALIEQPKNLTQKQTRTQISSYDVPHHHSDGTTSYTSRIYSYDVTSTYPAFAAPFTCQKKYIAIKNYPKDTENLKRELVHDVTKDYHGGVLVKSTKDDTEGKPFATDDVIVRIDQQRVEDEEGIMAALANVTKAKIPVQVIRGQKLVTLNVDTVDQTQSIKELQEKSIRGLCQKLPTEVKGAFDSAEIPTPAICAGMLKKSE